MDLTHRFTVPTDVASTWEHFQDIASVAQCFPGAQVTSAEGDTFSGTVKVKLGPIALVYNGSGTFVEKDEAAHRFVVDAKGKDKRGNGTAGAKVRLTMTEGAGGGTDVEVVTDLAITGKPAQFGRGVMQDVSDKLLGQFVTCLEQRLDGTGGADATGATGAAGAGGAHAASAAATAAPGSDSPEEAVPPASAGPQAVAAPEPEAADPAPAAPRHAASTPISSAPSYSSAGPAPQQDDALDLGATVLPVLIKGYWKEALGGLGLVALLVWLLRRR
ncbi:SRPBCC family protein [Nocardioides flavescens]|uniref:Carbon monoxide dehydrogenase n=1 Tax=Nocardioides flavescens TaxID=2691959 RepID=A0A6L7EXX1_9ACTN|nr:SRPBCC family protein [Nocardioides flavescens]MXG90398.1 carbon monoxide dehydrogenase [Nocardioides flavescens]